ncbi:unnamed protein product [Calicophoron daubneyi]|uniref:tRNA N(3)-methylcytidine methyltransferase n=1 Tax=Calicophoron daubneyi TaxID=300641 RepID=A0AAV2TIW9_CALDB
MMNSQANEEKRPAFGQRHLTDDAEVFSHNAWDDIQWTSEMEEEAQNLIDLNSAELLPADLQGQYEERSSDYWDQFYTVHQEKFFKDRAWLTTEFPELFSPTTCRRVIFEVGCGAGNTTIPILKNTISQDVFVYASDFSPKAVELLKENPDFVPSRCLAFTFDITKPDTLLPFPKESLDYVLMIFVLSAVNPDLFYSSLKNIVSYLKPGGTILFRDYGRFDMAQLRFKKGKCLSENFYLRSDGTRVYFFHQDELRELFQRLGLEELQNVVDRRLLVNRKRKLKMYRVWIQCKYMKPG